VLEVCSGTGVSVIVNDRVDVALATGAQGVHLGEEDMPVETARGLVGPGIIIGASVQDVAGARAAAAAGADYLGVGAIFRTPIKPEQEPISLDILREIRHEVKLPIVAIGGIDEKNAALPLEHGADGIAVISALRKCLDPKEGASRLRAAVDNFKKR
jgi:thiamine-phosphate diphosphorylase